MVVTQLVQKLIRLFILIAHLIGCMQLVHAIPDDPDEDKKNILALMRCVPAYDRKVVPLTIEYENRIPLSFVHNDSLSITEFQLDGKTIGHFIASVDGVKFEGHVPGYHFLLKHPLKTNIFTIDTKDGFTFQAAVKARSSFVKSKTTKLDPGITFLNDEDCHVYSDHCESKGHFECSDLFFQGKQFNARHKSSLKVHNQGVFELERGLFNQGAMSFNNKLIMDASSCKNLGSLDAGQFEFSGKKVTNKGSLRVGKNIHAVVTDLTLEGDCSAGKLAWFNVGNNAVINGSLSAPIISIDSQGEIACNEEAHFSVEQHLGLKAQKDIEFAGNALQEISAQKDPDPENSLAHEFAEGIFLQSHQGGINDTGDLTAPQGNVALLAHDHVAHTGNIQAQQAALFAPKIFQNGGIDAEHLVAIKGKEVLVETLSKINTQVACIDGDDKVLHRGKLSAVQNILMRSKLLSNLGFIDTRNMHLKADRIFYNSGWVKIAELLKLDALVALNIFGGRVDALTLESRAGIDCNFLGMYQVNNANMNSLVSCNVGLFLPRIPGLQNRTMAHNLGEAQKVLSGLTTRDTMYKIGKALRDSATAATAYKVGGRLLPLVLPPALMVPYSTAMTIRNIPNICGQVPDLYRQAKLLSQSDDVGVSDLIPLICDAKDLAFSVKQCAQTVALPVVSAARKGWEFLSIPKSLKDLTQFDITKLNSRQAVFALTGAAGYNINRSTLLNANAGLMAGIDGQTLSVWDMNAGMTAFAGSYAINTVHGTNYGKLGAGSLVVRAHENFNSRGSHAKLFGIDGSVNAKNIKTADSMSFMGNLGIRAQESADIASKIGASGVDVQARDVLLDKDCKVAADNAVNVVGNQVTTGAKVHSKNANLKGKNVETLESSHIDSATFIDAEQHEKRAGTFSGKMFFSKSENITTSETALVETDSACVESSGTHSERGKYNVKNGLSLKAKNMFLEKSSHISAGNAHIEAEEVLKKTGSADVKGRLTMRAKYGTNLGPTKAGSEQINFDRTFLNINMGSVGQSLSACSDYIADKVPAPIRNIACLSGQLAIGIFRYSRLAICGKYIANKMPEFIRDFVPPQEARPTWDEFWNSNGSMEVRENLTVNAGVSLNLCGKISAENFTSNTLVDLDLFGCYDVQNSRTSSFVGLNTGLAVSRLKKLDWEKIATRDNAKALAKIVAFTAAAKISVPLFLGLKGADLIYRYHDGRTLKRIPVLIDHVNALNGQNAGLSDYLPLLCEAKDISLSVAQDAITARGIVSSGSQYVLQAYNSGVGPVEIEKIVDKCLNPDFKSRPWSETGREITSGVFSGIVSEFGPNVKRDVFYDFNYGAALGVNGSSHSLYNVHGGASLFANNYSLQTYSGVNLGAIAATNVNISAVKRYASSGQIYSVGGSITADELDIKNKIYAIDRMSLHARIKAKIGGDMSGVEIKTPELILDKARIDYRDRPAHIVADSITGVANIKGQGVHLEGKNSIDLQTGSSVDSKDGITTLVSAGKVTTDAQVKGASVQYKAPEVEFKSNNHLNAQDGAAIIDTDSFKAEQGSQIKTTQGTFLKTKAIDSQVSIEGHCALQFTGDADQFKSLGHVDASDGVFHYEGTTRQEGQVNNLPSADELAEGSGRWGQITHPASIGLDAGTQDVHTKDEHVMSHALRVQTKGALTADKPLSSEKDLDLHAGKRLQHVSLKAGRNINRTSGESIATRSTTHRIGDAANYHDEIDQVSITAGSGSYAHAEKDIIQEGVKTSSGTEGTHYSAGGDIQDKALALESYNEKHCQHKKSEKHHYKSIVPEHSSAGDFTMRAGGKLESDAPQINSKQILLQGVRGVTLNEVHDIDSYSKGSEKSGGWFSSADKGHNEHYNATSQGAQLTGGGTPTIISGAEATLTNVSFDGQKMHIYAPTARINLGTNVDVGSHTSESRGWIWNSQEAHAHKHETFSVPRSAGTIECHTQETHVQVIRNQALDYAQRIKSDNGKLVYDMVDAVHFNNNNSHAQLTPQATAALVLGVSIATGGIASSIGAGTAAALGCQAGSTASLVIASMTSAAITSASAQAALALVENGGDIGKAAESLASQETFKAMAFAALTAGMMTGADQGLAALGVPLVKETSTFAGRIASAGSHEVVHAGVKTAIDALAGMPARDSLMKNIRIGLAGTLAAVGAAQVGDLYGNEHINPITHKVLHVAVGAASGAVINGAGGAFAGGLGALTAELAAELFCPDTSSIMQSAKALEVEKGHLLTQEEFTEHYWQKIASARDNAKLAAAVTALFAQQDVDVANFTASAALENNFLATAITAAAAGYSVYCICDAYNKDGAMGALQQMGIEIATGVAGYGLGKVAFKVGEVAYPTVKEALDVVLKNNPAVKTGLKSIYNKLVIAGEKISQSSFGQAIEPVETAIINAESRIVTRLGMLGKGNGVERIAHRDAGGLKDVINLVEQDGVYVADLHKLSSFSNPVVVAESQLPVAIPQPVSQTIAQLEKTIVAPVVSDSKQVAPLIESLTTKQIKNSYNILPEGGCVINGRFYTKHALERMAPKTPQVMAELEGRALAKGYVRPYQGDKGASEDFIKYVQPRDIPSIVIEDAIANGIQKIGTGKYAGTIEYTTVDLKVVINNRGDVITIHRI